MSSATNSNPPPSSTIENLLVVFNIIAQINEKLTLSTFPQWHAQFEALLIGYDLMDYVIGNLQCPSSNGTSTTSSKKTHWVRHDKLILSVILASTFPTIITLIATANTSQEVWKKLQTMYASCSWTRVMQLKEELTLIQRGNRSIPNYLHVVKALADDIALIDHPISEDDLTPYVLNGLGPDFGEIAAPILAREKSLMFEKFHDLLVNHESYLRRLEATQQQLVAVANFTAKKNRNGSQQQRHFSKQNGFRNPNTNHSGHT
ncbi:hypothetical protein F2P56_016057 [Juglans regia]|uniref:Retrovirus-related Pol polyprotein from transposon RE1 n=1 Tax=Juglans regia TaxID=51240 RepID=A0A833XHA9_JUGRE|nr:hypothetical protein F2P56_016057 [Juglans regia]